MTNVDGNRVMPHLLRSVRGRCKNCPIPIFASVYRDGYDFTVAEHYELPPKRFWTRFKVDPSASERDKEHLKTLLEYATYYRRDIETLLEIIDGLCSGEIDGKQLACNFS